ncbi:MAG: 5-formyltetrahydrofolate cyclo-ligase [Marinilabilia sp.]
MIKENKIRLRKEIKILKNRFTEEELKETGLRVMAELEKHRSFREAQNVFIYWSLPDEVPTHEFIEKWGREKRFILPRIVGDHLELREYHGFASLEKGPAFGIMEPTGPVFPDLDEIDLAVVPGLAFSNEGERLGRGGGYYDRTLPHLLNAKKIGVAFPFQMVKNVSCDSQDFLLDEVITIPS